MSKETTAKIARLAARFLNGEINTMTRKQLLSICASCVSQAEAEQESVKAWGYELDGELMARTWTDRDNAFDTLSPGERIIPVLIRRLRPARADKKRKRGKA